MYTPFQLICLALIAASLIWTALSLADIVYITLDIQVIRKLRQEGKQS